MLLPEDVHPEDTIYYHAGVLLSLLQEKHVGDLVTMFGLMKKKKKDLTFPFYLLVIDWLYLMDMIFIGDRGEVILCT